MTFGDDDTPTGRTKQAVYKTFERQLIGKTGQLALLAYADLGGKFFRFGQLEGEKLVAVEQGGFVTSRTLPISEFHAFKQGSWKVMTGLPEKGYEGDIFGKHERLDHAPPALYDYILGHQVRSLIVYLGTEQANHYFRTVEGTELEPSDWMKNLLEHGPDDHFLAALDPAPYDPFNVLDGKST